MSDASRREIFARVTQALGREPRPTAPAPPSANSVREVSFANLPELLDLFTVRWIELGGEVWHGHPAHDAQPSPPPVPSNSAATSLASFLQQNGCRTVAIETEARALLGENTLAGVTLVDLCAPEHRLRDLLFSCDAAITIADGAIAETGSLIMHSGAQRARLASLAPPLHVALLRRDTICADVLDALTRLSPATSAAFWVTGPSKTADIAGILVRGIHGPGRVAVMLL